IFASALATVWRPSPVVLSHQVPPARKAINTGIHKITRRRSFLYRICSSIFPHTGSEGVNRSSSILSFTCFSNSFRINGLFYFVIFFFDPLDQQGTGPRILGA